QWSAVSGQSPATCHLPPATRAHPPAPIPQPPLHHSQLTIPNSQLTIPLFPDLALGMLREGLTAAGRLWLLLRHLDEQGRGWLHINVVYDELTARDSELRLCGRRQLRNLLQQGGGIFWERDREHVWLKSAAKVATALGVKRLRGRPVLLPVETLLGGIGQVRAHFYASFHSGRTGLGFKPQGRPISRDKLEQITSVPARTQRDYDRAAGVVRQGNVAVGERHQTDNFQERAWGHGRAAFPYLDHEGRFGPAGGKYVAWRLPNSYEGPHDPGPMGRKKKINRQIDLVNIGAQGNGLSERNSKIFLTNGLDAGKAYNRDVSADIYWPANRCGGVEEYCSTTRLQATRSHKIRRWHVLPAKRKRR
ncbi:MAG: hypothetical protein PVH03_01955, partial [Chloroflexota bacterium]